MTTSPASSDSELRARVGANLEVLRQRIASTGRDVNSVRVVAVTKTFSREAVRAACEVGLTDFGENYVDELCAKRDAAPEGVWHFLGALQSNKIARATQCAGVLSGVSRDRELNKLASLASTSMLDIQVDFTQRAERNGAPPSMVPELVSRARELNLKVRGLMVVAPPDADLARAAFRRTGELADELGLVERSMGMSEDLEMACELGTTEVRIGRALFGPRAHAGGLA
jgi:uncharacterized pyridoxal phosphate-containing UPF0001 family protein